MLNVSFVCQLEMVKGCVIIQQEGPGLWIFLIVIQIAKSHCQKIKRKVNNANNTICQSARKKAGWGHNRPEQLGLVKDCLDVVGME